MGILQLFFSGGRKSRNTELFKSAADVLAHIPLLLRERDGCEKIEVFVDTVRLFGVACKDNASPVGPVAHGASAA